VEKLESDKDIIILVLYYNRLMLIVL